MLNSALLTATTEFVRANKYDRNLIFLRPRVGAVFIALRQRFSNYGPRKTSGPRVLPLWPS
jgi:hypothetical protein